MTPTLEQRIGSLMREHGIRTIVETGAAAGLSTCRFARMADQVVAIEIRPECVAAARAQLEANGIDNVRLLQGHSRRALADVVPSLPDNTLYFLDANGLRDHPIREEIFHIPRGRGVIVIHLAGENGLGSYDDVQDQLLRWSPNHRVEYHDDGEGGGGQFLIALPQRRIHVTFLIEKYSHEYGTSGLSINFDNLVDTLHQTGLATYDLVHYDERFHTKREIHPHEISKPAEVDEHLLVCTYHYHSPANPSVALLEKAKESGTKIAYVWLDKRTSPGTPEYARMSDVNVVLDGNDFGLPRAWPVFTPKNPRYFHDPGLERDIDVSLIGEVRHIQHRKDLIARLERETRIEVTIFKTSVTQTEQQLTLEEYTRVLKTSRISIALTKDVTKQLKGRIFETIHCGALLLCDINPYINTYFTPGEDYVPFRDYEDMVRKCVYYLEHEDERAAIARRGHAKAVKYYNYRVFWRSLLARAGMTRGEVARIPW